MAQEEEKKQKRSGPGLGDLARVARAGGGSRVATGAVLRTGAAALPVIAPYLAAIAAVFIIIIVIVIIIGVVFNFGFSGSRAGIVYGEEEEEKILSVEKTATPYEIEKNAPPTEVTYKITAKNITDNVTVKDVVIKDTDLAFEKSIGNLGPGDTHTETVKHTITDTSKDDIVTNIVTVTGTIPGAPPSADGLNYYILYGDTSIEPVNPEGIKAFANSRYPGNNIDVPCPGGVTCWDYVIAQSKAHKISPAFAITIWWEEGGFGGAGAGSEFGCFPGGDTSQVLDFQTSFNCFVKFTSTEHPYNAADPRGSFTEWVRYFCGPKADPICFNNPGFIDRLASIYDNDVAPGKIVYVSDGQNQGSGETVTVTATATVIIGNPPQGPPAYSPLKGSVYCSGYDYMGDSPSPCPNFLRTHKGVDIATYGSDWNVYSPFVGIATVDTVADCCGYGVYLELRSGTWTILMAHLERGSVRVRVGDIMSTGEVLGVMDDTGTSGGDHVHYEIREAGVLVDPKDHNALKDHP